MGHAHIKRHKMPAEYGVLSTEAKVICFLRVPLFPRPFRFPVFLSPQLKRHCAMSL